MFYFSVWETFFCWYYFTIFAIFSFRIHFDHSFILFSRFWPPFHIWLPPARHKSQSLLLAAHLSLTLHYSYFNPFSRYITLSSRRTVASLITHSFIVLMHSFTIAIVHSSPFCTLLPLVPLISRFLSLDFRTVSFLLLVQSTIITSYHFIFHSLFSGALSCQSSTFHFPLLAHVPFYLSIIL